MAASAVEQVAPIKIPLQFARQGIQDAIVGNPTGVKAHSLRFFSPGEPTQQMDVLHECVSFARSLNPTVGVELQTNGLFMNGDDAQWIAKNCNIVWFSLDGPACINDIHRPDAYGHGRTKEIEEYLALVANQTEVGVRATVVEESVDAQIDLVNHFHVLGIKDLALNPVIRPIYRAETVIKPVQRVDLMSFCKGFVQVYHHANALGINLSCSLTFNFDSKTNCACRSCVPMPQLNPDGSVSSCDMALYLDVKEQLQCFVYGCWDATSGIIKYDKQKISYLRNRTLENLPACRNCDLGPYCAGGCAGRIAYETGDPYQIVPEFCAAVRFLAQHIPTGRNVVRHTHP